MNTSDELAHTGKTKSSIPLRKLPAYAYYLLSKYSPELLTVLKGLTVGLSSLSYICILLLLMLYIYAVTGVLFLRGNDPWNFRSIEISMITLLRCAFFDGWGDVFYINYYGCDIYTAGVYTHDWAEDQHTLGGILYCATPEPQPVFICIYFLTFFFIVSFTALSLIIGAIGDAMMNATLDMKKKSVALKLAWQQKDAQKLTKKSLEDKNFNRTGILTKRTFNLLIFLIINQPII